MLLRLQRRLLLALLVVFARLLRRPARGGALALHLRDQVLEAGGLARQFGGALLLDIERALRLAQRLLPDVDQRRQARALVLEILLLPAEIVLFRGDRLAQFDEVAEIAGQRLGLRPQLRQHRAERHGGADRLQHVLGLHQQRRRRAMAHALQHGQHFGDHVAPALERAADRFLAARQPVEPLLDLGHAGVRLRHLGGRVQKRLIEPRAVLADRLDLGLDFRALFGGSRNSVLDAAQFELLALDRIEPRFGGRLCTHGRAEGEGHRNGDADGPARRGGAWQQIEPDEIRPKK
ncbi:MAG: hypothetical protein V9G24_15205 [Rhodoblastus sp.]